MLKTLKTLGAIVRFPLKAIKVVLGLILLCLGVGIGLYSDTVSDAVPWIGNSAEATFDRSGFLEPATFDPGVLLDPAKELELIQSVSDEVEPRLKQAQIVIRQQQAEVEFLRVRARGGRGEPRFDTRSTRTE